LARCVRCHELRLDRHAFLSVFVRQLWQRSTKRGGLRVDDDLGLSRVSARSLAAGTKESVDLSAVNDLVQPSIPQIVLIKLNKARNAETDCQGN